MPQRSINTDKSYLYTILHTDGKVFADSEADELIFQDFEIYEERREELG